MIPPVEPICLPALTVQTAQYWPEVEEHRGTERWDGIRVTFARGYTTGFHILLACSRWQLKEHACKHLSPWSFKDTIKLEKERNVAPFTKVTLSPSFFILSVSLTIYWLAPTICVWFYTGALQYVLSLTVTLTVATAWFPWHFQCKSPSHNLNGINRLTLAKQTDKTCLWTWSTFVAHLLLTMGLRGPLVSFSF